MKIRKLQLAARFALCKFFHDSGILFVELIADCDCTTVLPVEEI